MKKKVVWTESKALLTPVNNNSNSNYNWIFIPGGPGLGSESLKELTEILTLPGNVWHFDFPGDGSNTMDDEKCFSKWPDALIEATSSLSNVILVAHSSGGMFVLATPKLEKYIVGLVLMDSSPSINWQRYFLNYRKTHPLPEAEKLQSLYEKNPSNEILKKLTMSCAPYFSTDNSLTKMKQIMETLPFNYKAHLWAARNFHPTYKANWIPKRIPTLIFAGDEDPITPLYLFSESKEFQRTNIRIREVKQASHFPWVDNPEQVMQLFMDYCQWLSSIKKIPII